MLPSGVLKHEQVHCVSICAPGSLLKVQLQFIITVTLLLVSVALILWLFFPGVIFRGKE